MMGSILWLGISHGIESFQKHLQGIFIQESINIIPSEIRNCRMCIHAKWKMDPRQPADQSVVYNYVGYCKIKYRSLYVYVQYVLTYEYVHPYIH